MLRGIDEWNGQVFRVSRDRRRSLAPARGLRIVNRPAAHSHLASAHLRASATRPCPGLMLDVHPRCRRRARSLHLYMYTAKEKSQAAAAEGMLYFWHWGFVQSLCMIERKGRNITHVCSECWPHEYPHLGGQSETPRLAKSIISEIMTQISSNGLDELLVGVITEDFV